MVDLPIDERYRRWLGLATQADYRLSNMSVFPGLIAPPLPDVIIAEMIDLIGDLVYETFRV